MKKNRYLNFLVPILTLIVGFLAGLLLNFPPTDESELTGTVGKINNYRNVKITENDLLLRNELLGDDELAGQLKNYFSLHFLNTADLSEKLTSAVSAARSAGEFNSLHGKEVNDLDQLGLFLGEARKDLLLVLSALENLPEIDQQSMGLLINNATNALAQVNFREQKVFGFVEAAGAFLKEKGADNFPELAQVHDMLLLGQARSALLSDDKLKLKVLDGQSLLSSGDSLLSQFSPDGNQLQKLALSDLQSLGDLVPDREKLLTTLDVEVLGLLSKQGPLGLSPANAKLGLGPVFDTEKLGAVTDKDHLPSSVGASEKLSSAKGANEILGVTMDRDKLNIFLNNSSLGVYTDKNR